MAGSLFERLTQGAAGRALPEAESIRRHLVRLLTTRQGAVQALPEYGLPDLNDLTLSRSELLIRSCEEVKRCVTEYEPRLEDVEVATFSLDDEYFTVGFSITAAHVDENGNRIPWNMDLAVDGAKVTRR